MFYDMGDLNPNQDVDAFLDNEWKAGHEMPVFGMTTPEGQAEPDDAQEQ